MLYCCTQRPKGKDLSNPKRPLTPHQKQQHQELLTTWAKERRTHKEVDQDQWKKSWVDPNEWGRGNDPREECHSLLDCVACMTVHDSNDQHATVEEQANTRDIQLSSVLAGSPSSLQRRKKSEPLPIPVEEIACSNFDCMTSECQTENWTVARLGSRVFRFCSQECWTVWLENPGHLGSWSSPLLSYQTSPEMEPRSSRDSYTDSPLMAELGLKKRPTVNLLDLPPLMI